MPIDAIHTILCKESTMTIVITREQLHKQIDALPDDVVEQIADFTLFLIARRQLTTAYAEWNGRQ